MSADRGVGGNALVGWLLVVVGIIKGGGTTLTTLLGWLWLLARLAGGSGCWMLCCNVSLGPCLLDSRALAAAKLAMTLSWMFLISSDSDNPDAGCDNDG